MTGHDDGARAALLACEVTLVPSLLLAAHWLPVCSCRWVGSVHEKYHAAVTEGIDHMEDVRVSRPRNRPEGDFMKRLWRRLTCHGQHVNTGPQWCRCDQHG